MIEDKLIELLSTFGFPVKRQGSIAEDEAYPDTFFTFWCRSEEEQSAYDNQTQFVIYTFDVNIYSNDVEKAYSLTGRARTLLKENGFIILSRAYDVPSDEDTHTGRSFNVCFINREN